MVSVGLRVTERDLPERDEGDQPEPGNAAKGDHAEQEQQGAETVGLLALELPSAIGRERAEEGCEHE